MEFAEAVRIMKDEKPVCTMCGHPLTEMDILQNFTFTKTIGYGSRYDLTTIHMHICCDCFDKIMDWVVPRCDQNPITELDE